MPYTNSNNYYKNKYKRKLKFEKKKNKVLSTLSITSTNYYPGQDSISGYLYPKNKTQPPKRPQNKLS